MLFWAVEVPAVRLVSGLQSGFKLSMGLGLDLDVHVGGVGYGSFVTGKGGRLITNMKGHREL